MAHTLNVHGKNKRVRVAIIKAGYTQASAARKIGYDPCTFSRILSTFELADFEQDQIINKINRLEPLVPQKQKANAYIREALAKTHIPVWKLADELCISEPTMHRKLRHELPMEEQERIVRAIYRMKEAI